MEIFPSINTVIRKGHTLTPETKAWLYCKVPGFSQLKEQEREAIYDFSLLWSLFEGSALNYQCNVLKIRQLASNIVRKNKLNDISLDSYVEYLRNRYYVNGSLTQHYQNLHVERSGSPAEVVEMLCDEDSTETVQLIGCLVVIFRLRNNLFHGEKWRYQLRGQFDNFQNANGFLRNLMDCV